MKGLVILTTLIMGVLLMLSTAQAGFNLTTTSQWDNGTKSNSTGNYEIETYTDNLNIFNNWLELGNMYSDRFTFADTDGLTWKWKESDGTLWGINTSGGVATDISNGTYNFVMWDNFFSPYGNIIMKYYNTSVQTDFDTSIDLYMPSSGTGDQPDVLFAMFKADGVAYCYQEVYSDAIDTWTLYTECTDDAGTNVAGSIYQPTFTQPDLNISLRLTRIGTVCAIYYDEHMDETWTLLTDSESEGWGDCFSGETRPALYTSASWHDDDNVTIRWDNFKIDTHPDIPVRTTGNWTSANITMDVGKKLANTTIKFYNPNEDTCIDSISWLVGGVSKASYTTDICNYTTTSTTAVQQANGLYERTSGYWSQPSLVVDNDWDTYHMGSGSWQYMYLSYPIPTGATNNSVWRIKDGEGLTPTPTDFNIPDVCMSSTEIDLRVGAVSLRAGKYTYRGVDWGCWNGTDWQSLKYVYATAVVGYPNYIYEQEVRWDIAESTATITAPTTGTFANVNTNFTIQMLLKGDGFYSPNIKEVSGEYKIDPNQIGITAYYVNPTANYNSMSLFTGNWTLADLVNLTPRYNITYLQTTEYTTTTVANATYVAQSIKYTTGDKNLSAIGVKIGTYYAQQLIEQKVNITVNLVADNSGQPTGSVLATGRINWNQYPTSMTGRYAPMMVFELNTTSYNLTNNTVYWIVVKPDFWTTAGYNHNYFGVEYANTNVYANGWMAVSSNAGSTWTHYNTTTTYDINFALLNRDGVSAYNGTITQNGNPMEYKVKNNTHLNTVGTATLTLNAGEILSKNVSVAGAGYILTGGSLFAGGSTIINGNSTNHVTINATGTYMSYGVLMSDFVYYPTKFKANWLDIKGSFASGALYTSGVFSTIGVSNSNITNSYNAAGGYTLRAMYSERQQQFNNCTFYHTCSTCAYNIYFYTVTDTQFNCVDCKIVTTGNYALAIYNGNIYNTWKPDFISTTYAYNGGTAVPLNTSHFANAFQNGYLGLGNIVNPTILNSSGIPIANATVTITPQYHEWEDEMLYTGYIDDTDPMGWGYYGAIQVYTMFDKPRTWITNTDGQPEDENGNAQIYMMDSVYYGQSKAKVVNYGGSRTDLRQDGYTWKNDGTDYGYILTVTATGYQGQQMVIPSNQSYTGNITLLASATPSVITEDDIILWYVMFLSILALVVGVFAYYYKQLLMGIFCGFIYIVLGLAVAMSSNFGSLKEFLIATFILFGISYLTIMSIQLTKKKTKKDLHEI
jgi:hypothetical protein